MHLFLSDCSHQKLHSLCTCSLLQRQLEWRKHDICLLHQPARADEDYDIKLLLKLLRLSPEFRSTIFMTRLKFFRDDML